MPWTELDRHPRDPDVRQGLALMGAAVARRRQRLRMSQRELARRSGVDQSSISRFERGLQFCIRWSRFARIVVVLGGLDFDLDARDANQPRRSPTWNELRAGSLAEWLAEWQATEEAIRRDAAEEAEAPEEAGHAERTDAIYGADGIPIEDVRGAVET